MAQDGLSSYNRFERQRGDKSFSILSFDSHDSTAMSLFQYDYSILKSRVS